MLKALPEALFNTLLNALLNALLNSLQFSSPFSFFIYTLAQIAHIQHLLFHILYSRYPVVLQNTESVHYAHCSRKQTTE